MDTYKGDIFDPVSLHKYLYANADPVTYCDPSGYVGEIAILSIEAREAAFAMAVYATLMVSLRNLNLQISMNYVIADFLFDSIVTINEGVTNLSIYLRDFILNQALTTAQTLNIAFANIYTNSISKADAKIRERIRKDTHHKFWEINMSPYPTIGKGLTEAAAIARLMAGGSVITIFQFDAKRVSNYAGLGKKS